MERLEVSESETAGHVTMSALSRPASTHTRWTARFASSREASSPPLAVRDVIKEFDTSIFIGIARLAFGMIPGGSEDQSTVTMAQPTRTALCA